MTVTPVASDGCDADTHRVPTEDTDTRFVTEGTDTRFVTEGTDTNRVRPPETSARTDCRPVENIMNVY